MEFSSKLIEQAVTEIARLPGIGKKTALRLVLHLIKENPSRTEALTGALTQLRTQIQFCQECHNISDDAVCIICRSHKRDRSVICVVENPQDVWAIENTAQYHGLYHVLGGVISPVQGIGPADLKIEMLLQRLKKSGHSITELILALSPTMEGDTTAFYLHKRLHDFSGKITSIARGVPMGGDLEYADEITLGRSIAARTLFS